MLTPTQIRPRRRHLIDNGKKTETRMDKEFFASGRSLSFGALCQKWQTINEVFGHYFLCIYSHIHSWKFDGYPPFDRLHKIQNTPGGQVVELVIGFDSQAKIKTLKPSYVKLSKREPILTHHWRCFFLRECAFE